MDKITEAYYLGRIKQMEKEKVEAETDKCWMVAAARQREIDRLKKDLEERRKE